MGKEGGEVGGAVEKAKHERPLAGAATDAGNRGSAEGD